MHNYATRMCPNSRICTYAGVCPGKEHFMEKTTDPTAVIIVVSDRVFGGERKDKASPAAIQLLTEAGFQVAPPVVIPEGDKALRGAMAQAVKGGNSLILTCGGTGLGPRNLTPEVSEEFISTRLHGTDRRAGAFTARRTLPRPHWSHFPGAWCKPHRQRPEFARWRARHPRCHPCAVAESDRVGSLTRRYSVAGNSTSPSSSSSNRVS